MTTPFDSAISHLTNRMNSRGDGSEREELRQSIRVLEDWPRWEPLIKAAGRVTDEDRQWVMTITPQSASIIALLEALPEEGK